MSGFNISVVTSGVQPVVQFVCNYPKFFIITSALAVIAGLGVRHHHRNLEARLEAKRVSLLAEEAQITQVLAKIEEGDYSAGAKFIKSQLDIAHVMYQDDQVKMDAQARVKRLIEGLREFPGFQNILAAFNMGYWTIGFLFLYAGLTPLEAVELLKGVNPPLRSLEDSFDGSFVSILLANRQIEAFKELGISINRGLLQAVKLSGDGFERTGLQPKFRELLQRRPFVYVDWALKRGAKVDEMIDRTGHLELPFHYAVRNGMFDVAEHLLQKGANVDSLNYRGQTPLLKILNFGKFSDAAPYFHEYDRKKVEFLLNHKANTEVRQDGLTPFHIVMQSDHYKKFDIAQLLVDHGADINALNSAGETELHAAVRARDIKAIEFLMRNHAKILPNKDKKTPIHLAKDNPEILIF